MGSTAIVVTPAGFLTTSTIYPPAASTQISARRSKGRLAVLPSFLRLTTHDLQLGIYAIGENPARSAASTVEKQSSGVVLS